MRIINSFKNIISTMAGRILYILLSFVTRTVFIQTLSSSYLGVTSTFNSIFTVLTLSELGIGTSILYSLYKPLGENDTETLKSLMSFAKRSYRIVAAAFVTLGLGVMPFLPILTKGGSEIVNIYIIYAIYLSSVASSYCFFASQALILNAGQKYYLIAGVSYLCNIAQAIVKIILLYSLRSRPALAFYLYHLTDTVTTLFINYLSARVAQREYPFLLDTNVQRLDPAIKKGVFRNLVGTSVNNVCRVLNDGIDSVVISSIMGVAVTGVFSNYIALRAYVNRILSSVFGPITASVGDLCAMGSTEKKENFFEILFFSYFWIYGFCAICLWILLDPFIAGVWLNSDWLMSPEAVFLLAFNFLFEGLASAAVKYRDANGLFWQTKYRYAVSSVFNIFFSIYLVGVRHMGPTGALLGTTISLAIMLCFDPILVYREVFHKKAGQFYINYIKYMALTAATAAAVWLLGRPFAEYTAVNFLIKLVLCLVVPNGVWFLLFRRDPKFLYLRDVALMLLRRTRSRLRGSKKGA